MSGTTRVRIRRVEFRNGSDADLTALHAIETPIEAERGSNRMPARLESYKAFARNLPSQFDDHTWLAETPDGSPVASGYCWSNAAGDPRVMECDVLVRHDRRREGIGSQLFAEICEATAGERRELLTWSTFDTVPAGEVWSRRLGARVARVNRTSELRLDGVDWAMIEDWAQTERPRQLGYTLEAIDGPIPAHLRADAATFHHIMQTAPRDDLDVADERRDESSVAEVDRVLTKSGRIRWTLLVRDSSGACVGGTEVTYEPWAAEVIHQQNTGIDPAHRGLGLAKWAKAAMLRRIKAERHEVRTIRTANAFSNEPMLAINDTLGFQVVKTHTEWMAFVDQTLANLATHDDALLALSPQPGRLPADRTARWEGAMRRDRP